MEKTMEKIVQVAKARGFVYPGSEIYGGLANTWDYGNLGVELKNNVKRAWWQKFIQENPYNVGVDCAILMSKQLLSQINKIVPFSPSSKFKSVDEASEYAKRVSGVFSKPGLERVEVLLEGVGHPERGLDVVHVTGTNGKGSFVAMLSSIFKTCLEAYLFRHEKTGSRAI